MADSRVTAVTRVAVLCVRPYAATKPWRHLDQVVALENGRLKHVK
jgi:hypothetical protein